MIGAYNAYMLANSNNSLLTNSPECKFAIDKLEKEIKSKALDGKTKICYNVNFLSKDNERLGNAYYNAIKEYMEKCGYVFYFHHVMNIDRNYSFCFTCSWNQ